MGMCFSCYLCCALRAREAAQNVSCVPVPWEPGACGRPEPQVPGMSPGQQPQRQPQETDKPGHPGARRSSLLGDSDTLCAAEGSTKEHTQKKKMAPAAWPTARRAGRWCPPTAGSREHPGSSLQAIALKLANEFLSQKVWMLCKGLCLSPAQKPRNGQCSSPVQSYFSVCLAVGVLWVWTPLVFSARCFGGWLSCSGLNRSGAPCRVRTFALQPEAPGFEFFPDYWSIFHIIFQTNNPMLVS